MTLAQQFEKLNLVAAELGYAGIALKVQAIHGSLVNVARTVRYREQTFDDVQTAADFVAITMKDVDALTSSIAEDLPLALFFDERPNREQNHLRFKEKAYDAASQSSAVMALIMEFAASDEIPEAFERLPPENDPRSSMGIGIAALRTVVYGLEKVTDHKIGVSGAMTSAIASVKPENDSVKSIFDSVRTTLELYREAAVNDRDLSATMAKTLQMVRFG